MLAMTRSTLGPRGSILRGDDDGPSRSSWIILGSVLGAGFLAAGVAHYYGAKFEKEGYGTTRKWTPKRKWRPQHTRRSTSWAR